MSIDGKPLRRGPLDRVHADAGDTFIPADGAAAPWQFPHAADRTRCALADLTALARAGYKGWRVWSVLAEQGLSCPQVNNTATVQPDGAVCLRLGDSEAFLLAKIARASESAPAWACLEPAHGFYPVPRRDTHVWLLLTGAAAPSVLSKLCAVDLRPHKFAELQVAQTSIAGVGATVLRRDREQIPSFHLLADTSSASYLWRELLHASAEHAGGPVGLHG